MTHATGWTDEARLAMGRGANAVGTRLCKVGRDAARARRASLAATTRAAAAAEHRLTERGTSPQRLTEAVIDSAGVAREEIAKTTKRARKKIARNAKQTRKALAHSADLARKERIAKQKKMAKLEQKTAKKLARAAGGQRRRWPWLLGVGAVAIAVVYFLRSRAAREDQPATITALDEQRASSNGEAPQSRQQTTDDRATRPN